MPPFNVEPPVENGLLVRPPWMAAIACCTRYGSTPLTLMNLTTCLLFFDASSISPTRVLMSWYRGSGHETIRLLVRLSRPTVNGMGLLDERDVSLTCMAPRPPPNRAALDWKVFDDVLPTS